MMGKFTDSMKLLDEGINQGVFPGAVACIGDKNGIIREKCVGHKALYPECEKMEINALFDMASLTKVVASTPMVMVLLQQGKLSLYDFVGDYLEPFKDDTELRIINLLTHTSGFEPFSDLYNRCKDFEEAVKYISTTKRVFPVNNGVLYSDYNFILVKAIIEKILGEPMDTVCTKYVFEPIGMKDTSFNPKDKERAIATEFDPGTGKYLRGIVHDENARFFNGVSGHAGLFSTAHDLSLYCSMYLNEGKLSDGSIFLGKNTIECMLHNYTAGMGESRGIGFCIKNYENSSAGELMSEGSFGHTGFTGSCLWIDRKLGIYIILLTNRVHPDRSNNKIIRFRRLFNNTVIFEAGLERQYDKDKSE